MSERIEAAIRAIELVKAEPFRDRRVREWSRANRAIHNMLRPGSFCRVPLDADWAEMDAWWSRDTTNHELTEDERLALEELVRELFAIRLPDRGGVLSFASLHKAERRKKRWIKRSERRLHRRQDAGIVRQQLADRGSP